MKLGTAILNLLFPPKCTLCRRVLNTGEQGLCGDCARKIQGDVTQIRGTFFSRCVVALFYGGTVRQAIHRFKFQGRREYACTFGGLMAEAVKGELTGTYDLITWIPVSRKRLRERGYDQGALLAEAMGKALGQMPVAVLEKSRDNTRQSTLTDPKLREKNVKGVYCVPEPERIQGRRILLIDDVVTTGATMEEAARTLLKAGATAVVAAALARPPEKHTKEEQL